jgi:hypothetical protein
VVRAVVGIHESFASLGDGTGSLHQIYRNIKFFSIRLLEEFLQS